MNEALEELAKTVAKIQDARDLVDSRRAYRDRQIREAIKAGATWKQIQDVTGLSPRGVALAIKRV